MLTTKIVKVHNFNKTNGEETFKNRGQVNSIKKGFMAQIEDQMVEEGLTLTKSHMDILGLLVYNTCVTGVQSISLSKLVEKSGYSRATVARAVKAIKATSFFAIGYLGNERKGHYVFVLKMHKNYGKIMFEIFNETSCDNSNDNSSNSEIPCGSKAEGQENIPTLSTLDTFNTSLKNKKENQSVEQIVDMELDKSFLPEYVPNYFADLTAPFLSLKEVEELYQVTTRTFNKYANHRLVLSDLEEEVTSSFKTTVYKIKTGKVKAKFKDIKQYFVGVFKDKLIIANRKSFMAGRYNWLEEAN
jgi:DNA-binding transcriptional regulator GbsR (MarR family)